MLWLTNTRAGWRAELSFVVIKNFSLPGENRGLCKQKFCIALDYFAGFCILA